MNVQLKLVKKNVLKMLNVGERKFLKKYLILLVLDHNQSHQNLLVENKIHLMIVILTSIDAEQAKAVTLIYLRHDEKLIRIMMILLLLGEEDHNQMTMIPVHHDDVIDLPLQGKDHK
jgi:hypothetical protein